MLSSFFKNILALLGHLYSKINFSFILSSSSKFLLDFYWNWTQYKFGRKFQIQKFVFQLINLANLTLYNADSFMGFCIEPVHIICEIYSRFMIFLHYNKWYIFLPFILHLFLVPEWKLHFLEICFKLFPNKINIENIKVSVSLKKTVL